MPSLVFDKCCGCIELKTGCFIIGYLNLVGILIMTILTALAVIGGAVVANDNENPDFHKAGILVTVVAGIVLIFMLFGLAFAIVLLVGLHQNKPGHLKAYLIYSAIFIVVSIVNFISVCASSADAGGIIQNLLTILLSIYFLLVIRSMYFQMKDPSRGPAIYSAA